jgi:L-ribulose-5-phosphate 3-epimerase
MLFGYNTNGFAHHRLEDTLAILAELGYRSVALTLDFHALNPFEPELPRRVESVRRLLEQHRLRCVVETGARFLLDARHKHQPTLISPTPGERQYRLDFLCQAIGIARELGADAMSFWSGAAVDEAPSGELFTRLVSGCNQLLEVATREHVRLAFEPEPGMYVDTMDRFCRLHERILDPLFGLTLDLGHLHCQGEDVVENIRHWADLLFNAHIEDMRRGVHDHLMFGEGEIDFGPVLRTLTDVGYAGGVHVELSRHSHDAVETARRAIGFLRGVARDAV